MSEHILVEGGAALQAAGLVHRVHQPRGAGPHRTLVLLHGRGGNEDVMWIFSRSVPDWTNWVTVAPRGIAPWREGDYSWHRWQGQGFAPWSAYDEAASAMAQFIHALPGLYGADAAQTYLIGFSQGATLSLATAIHHPGLVQGLAALMGFLPPDAPPGEAASALQGLPVFMAAGKNDKTVPLALTQPSAEALRAAGARLTYGEYDTAHKMSPQALDDLKQWWRGLV